MTLRHTLLLVALVFAAPSLASADVIPMDVEECDMLSVGSSCTDHAGPGVCTADTCTRLDYAHWDRDASASPPGMEYACVRCVVGPIRDSGTIADAGSMAARPTSSCSVAVGGGSASWLGLAFALALVLRRRIAR